MLSLGGERLNVPPPRPPPKKKKKKFWLITCTTIWICHHYYGVFSAHLLILEYPDHHQNLTSSSLCAPETPPYKLYPHPLYNFVSNLVHRQTNKRYQKHNHLCQGW